jgi:hypothetical protein
MHEIYLTERREVIKFKIVISFLGYEVTNLNGNGYDVPSVMCVYV